MATRSTTLYRKQRADRDAGRMGSYKGHGWTSTKTNRNSYKTELPNGKTVWMTYSGNHKAYMDRNDAKKIAAGADPREVRMQRDAASVWGSQHRAQSQSKPKTQTRSSSQDQWDQRMNELRKSQAAEEGVKRDMAPGGSHACLLYTSPSPRD